MRATVLTIALSSGSAVFAEAGIEGSEDVLPGLLFIEAESASLNLRPGDTTAGALQAGEVASLERSLPEPASFETAGSGDFSSVIVPGAGQPTPTAELRAAVDAPVSELRLAQFQLPPTQPGSTPGTTPETAPGGMPDSGSDSTTARRPRSFVQHLTYQYGYGSESQISYLNNPDLNRRGVADNLLIVAPQINGIIIYRPTDWLEATLEMIASIDIPSRQPDTITLPNGQVVFDQPTRSELLVDQGFVTLKRVIAPFEASVGRRNYEDERHWLYDTSLDVGALTFRQGAFRIDTFAGREVYKNLNLIPGQFQVKDRINTASVYVDYRGIEDLRLAAYQISRKDLSHNLGYPRLTGVRAIGRPSDEFNFWTELAYAGGRDPLYNKYSGRGFDVGFTYRFLDLPLRPNVTLGYAYGSGDDNPNDGTNHTFLQTGLQSNEARFAGVSKFKYYGEALDPELSNLKILTVGLGFWPAPSVTVDLVYHNYRLPKIAAAVAGSRVTAEMNQIDILVPSLDPNADPVLVPRTSKAVGQGFDVVIGLRNLFGLRRLGVDLRMGWFFPGNAYDRNDGTEMNPLIRRAETMFNVVAKFWW